MLNKNSFKQLPNEKGYFGQFGGRYVSETLMPLILEVEKEYFKIKNDSKFQEELNLIGPFKKLGHFFVQNDVEKYSTRNIHACRREIFNEI